MKKPKKPKLTASKQSWKNYEIKLKEFKAYQKELERRRKLG